MVSGVLAPGIMTREARRPKNLVAHRRARVKAAERDTSVSALVRQFLAELAGAESETERLKREERAIREEIHAFRATDRLTRDSLHERGT